MKSSNRLRETVLIVLVIVVVLLGLSLTDSSFSVGDLKMKRVDILSDIKTSGLYLKAPAPDRILTDSIIRQDKAAYIVRKANPASIVDFGQDSLPALTTFFNSLSDTEQRKKKTRIGYFGDSMIEGDLVTQDLRTAFQDTFGGTGVGFMPITSIVAGFRQSIIHTFSDNWQTYSLLDKNGSNHTLGITGFDFVPSVVSGDVDTVATNAGSWVKYRAVGRKHLDKFYNVHLFYGTSSAEGNIVTGFGKIFSLKGTATVNELVLVKSSPVQAVNLSFQCKGAVNIFGLSMEGDSGVYVDNFSFRGNSGMPLTKIPATVLSGMNEKLDYGLIILHYGVNVVNHNVTDFSWYERGMTEVVNHLKAAMPKASILIVTTGDKSIKQDGAFVTDPSIPLVIEVQKRVAEKTGVAFWNLYEAMGGYNSMVKWVEGDTILANKDYTHPNARGAKKIADLLYGYLLAEYKAYVKKQKV